MFWANDPAVTTPISADNLSRLEKYTLATAGANGDFYVNYPVGASLATNDIVYIAFPAATNGASNARLSVNNGTTYKNIKLSTIRIASEVASRKLSFVYDGTDFVPLETEFFPITYTPTITSQGGILTTVAKTGKYIKVGRRVTVWIFIDIQNKGTGTGYLNFTLPIAASEVQAGTGFEFNATAFALGVVITAGLTGGIIAKYDATTIIANGNQCLIEITYLVA
jgi:hypothetical protein